MIFHCVKSVRIQENMDQKKLRIWTLFTQCSFLKVFQGIRETFVDYTYINNPRSKVEEVFSDIIIKNN